MLIRKASDLRYSDITPKSVWLNRRSFLTGLPLAFAASRDLLAAPKLGARKSPLSTSEKLNTWDEVTHYNNYYEFGTRKDQPAELAKNFKTTPWSVAVEGACDMPRKFSMDELMKLAPIEERIYRHRCVEGWSIVVPWNGYSLKELLNVVKPNSKAKFVAFETYYDAAQMPQGKYSGLKLPYVEGLRLDEAMHPLAMLTVGMYDELLPPQSGAPIRLNVPWKYGFKSIKSLVKIRLVEQMPPTTWNINRAVEYGFYSNVNPKVDHPRWSQATERRLGELPRRPTLMFNGYGDQVAGLYKGMDLKINF